MRPLWKCPASATAGSRTRGSRREKCRRSSAVHPKVGAHKDCDARWTKKNHETFYGYKDHVKVDVADKLILDGVTTPANVHDSQPIEELVKAGG